MREWETLEAKIRELPLSKARNMQRFFFASAADVEPDKQGRVCLLYTSKQIHLIS